MDKTVATGKRGNPALQGANRDGGPIPGARRETILSVARDLFFSHGFASASMRDLAAGIGVTQAALYHHFPSKDEILFAIVDGFTELLRETVQRALNETGDPVRDLFGAVRQHILLNRSHSREIKLVIEDKKLLASAYAERMRQREMVIYLLYRDRVSDLMQAGLMRPLTPSVVVFNLLATINFIFQWYRPDGPLRLEEVADQTVEMLSAGLVIEGGKPSTRRPPKRPAGRTTRPGDTR